VEREQGHEDGREEEGQEQVRGQDAEAVVGHRPIVGQVPPRRAASNRVARPGTAGGG
jgi:hypothetical protein